MRNIALAGALALALAGCNTVPAATGAAAPPAPATKAVILSGLCQVQANLVASDPTVGAQVGGTLGALPGTATANAPGAAAGAAIGAIAGAFVQAEISGHCPTGTAPVTVNGTVQPAPAAAPAPAAPVTGTMQPAAAPPAAAAVQH